MTSLRDLINMHGYFLYELNKSWESEKLDLTSYLKSLRDFIGIRDSIYRTLLINAAESVNTWDSFNNLFKGLNEYVTSTITFLAKAVLSKNEKAANILVESLLEFSEFLDSKGSPDHYYNLLTYDKSAQALIVPTLLNKSLDEVKQIFSSLKMYDKIKNIKERTLFFNILKNYLEDCCFIMIAFFLLFQKKSNNSVEELAINITRLLKNNKLIDHYFTSFIRRNAYHHFNDEEYGAMLDKLARRIVFLTEEGKVPLRGYVTVGSSIDKICDADIIVAAIIISLRSYDNKDASNSYTSLMEVLCKNDLIQNLINKIETILKNINPQHVKTTQLYKEFVEIYDMWVESVKGVCRESASPSNTDTTVNSADISAKETTPDLIDKLDQISIVFKELLQSAKDAQSRYIKDLPISQEKLNDIAKKCSTKAFDKNTAYFPVNHFKEVVPVEEELNKFTLILKGLSKREFTEEESHIIHYANDGYEHCVSEHLYKYLILDILAEAEKSNVVKIINVDTKAKYIENILKYGALLKKENLTPILIAEDCTSPEWVNEWNNARWKIDNKLVNEQAEIKYNFSHNNPPNYLFHINSIPLYIGRAITDGTLLLPKEILRTLKFRKYDSGNLVNVTFEQQDNNPQQGSLIFSWERTIELDLQYKIYKITYPKSIDEE